VTVHLVGAGPGHPDLLTLRAARLLAAADVVVHDRLVHPGVLDLVRPGAPRIDVGKDAGDSHLQERINATLVELGRVHDCVVRLKGGDPFVFGRGGEEMLALAEAGVPFEVVPGVTSSIGVPGVAGIPVTHRGASTAFAVFTAHEAEDATEGPVDWVVAARVPTAVFLMGVERLPVIVSKLIAHGRRVDTPIAIVEQGTCDAERVTTGTLGTILARARDVRPPATIVVGEVVEVREAVRALQAGQPSWRVPAALSPRAHRGAAGATEVAARRRA
jgi:uroporphyrin-III C-methyltransferase